MTLLLSLKLKVHIDRTEKIQTLMWNKSVWSFCGHSVRWFQW